MEIISLAGFHFAQVLIPNLLLSTGQTDTPGPTTSPTLIFTGATASLRGSKMLSSFAVGKSGLRVMVQSLAREFGPRGVHVSHVIIDGLIDIPQVGGDTTMGQTEGKIAPETIADTYWYLHTQPRSGFTHELEIRPASETW